MKSNRSWRIRLSQILLGAAIVLALVVVRGAKAGDEPTHLVTDWSHRHVVYSEPNTPARRQALASDTRYVQQQRRREADRRGDRNEWRWRPSPVDPRHVRGDWSMDMGAGATVGAGNFPAKFSFSTTTANCASAAQPDFVVYNTGLAGTGSQATIVAFDNLYVTTCTGTVPTVYWAYNTGSAGTAVLTSPVLSFDGQQVAFVQSTAGSTTGSATLVILRWKANDGTLAAPVTPGAGPCAPAAAPCQITISFSTANGDPNTADNWSSPFYDYNNDDLYVGDNGGYLHKFTGVFRGTPAEVVSLTGNPTVWPINLDSPYGHLNSPVFVRTSNGVLVNEVLVTDSSGLIYAVDSTLGGFSSATYNNLDPKLADPGFDDAPLVDVTTGKVFLFARAASEFITPADPPFHGTPGVPSIFQIDIPTTPINIHLAPYIQAIISNGPNSGTATIGTVPVAADTITLGATTYKFVTTLVNPNDVLIVAGSTANTAQNLQAAINANSTQCFAAPCFGTGTTSNSSIRGTVAGSVVQVNASGIVFTTISGGRITLNPNTGTLATIAIPSAMYGGAFDDVYNGSGVGTGFLYACGTNTVGATTSNAIWYTAVDAGVIDTATVLGPTITTAMSACSPITEFNNGSNDRIFLSVAANAVTASPILCPTGSCIMSFGIDSLLSPASGTTARVTATGGTSGIIIDNSVGSTGASQIYFTPLADQSCTTSGGTGGCAIQASQSLLN